MTNFTELPSVPSDRLVPFTDQLRLVLRSLKHVYKASAVGARFGLGPSPDPGPGPGVELGGGDLCGVGDLVGVGEGLPGQRGLAEDPPPAFLQVEPAGALGDEGVADVGMAFQPGLGVLAVVTGEVVALCRRRHSGIYADLVIRPGGGGCEGEVPGGGGGGG